MLHPQDRMKSAMLIGLIILNAALSGCGGRDSSTLPHTPTTVSGISGTTPASTVSATRTRASGVRGQATSSPYSALILAGHPLAYYQLNDNTSTLVDSGQYAIAGTYGSSLTHQALPITQGSTSATGFPGGSAYNPNGFAYTPPSTTLQPGLVTLEAWIKCSAANSMTRDIPIVVYGNESVGVRYGLYLHSLGSNVSSLSYVQNNSGQASELRLYGSTRLGVGITYHVVAVSDGTHVTTYVNGLPDQTAAYPGYIDYSAPPSNGLQIGGDSLNSIYGSAPFPGTIAQVAVYGSAMPLTQIVAHYLAGQLVPMATEGARRSDSIVDSIGVSTHFDDYRTIYSTQFEQVKTLLVASGIRHIRVGMSFNNSGYLAQMQQLAAYGIHGTYITSLGMTQSQIVGFPFLVYPSFERYEPPNEQDDLHGIPIWVPGCIAFQKNLFTWVKGNPRTAWYPVLGPGLAWPSSFQKLGDLSAYMDYGNVHDYLGLFNPGNPYAVYGGIKFVVNAGRTTSGTKPLVATETGYGTIANDPLTLDYGTHLRYMTRLFLEQFNAGIERTYTYELIDQGGTAPFQDYGILQSDLTPKPAYTGLKSLIAALQDPGIFQTSSLTYKLSGFSSNVHHLLMQKRNGSFILALWIEVPGWNVNGGGVINVPNQTVTLATSNSFSRASLSAMDDYGNFATSSLPWSNGQATFSVSDKVSLVTLSP